jgi:hypothetical protein
MVRTRPTTKYHWISLNLKWNSMWQQNSWEIKTVSPFYITIIVQALLTLVILLLFAQFFIYIIFHAPIFVDY